jgi:hypothetical protein
MISENHANNNNLDLTGNKFCLDKQHALVTIEKSSEPEQNLRQKFKKEAFEKIVIGCLGGETEKPLKKMMEEINKNEYDAQKMENETPGLVFQVFFRIEVSFNAVVKKVCEVSALPFRISSPHLQSDDIRNLINDYRTEFLDIYRKNRLEINKKLNISEAADFTESDVIVSIDSISRFVSDKFKSENTKIGKNDKVGFELDLKRLQELLAC